MALTVLVTKKFARSKRRVFHKLAEALTRQCADVGGKQYLIGNFAFGRNLIDGIYIGENAICVIVIRYDAGLIRFSRTEDWFANGTKIERNAQGNPFQQARFNKFALLNYLSFRQWRVLEGSHVVNWGHIKGAVIFKHDIALMNELPIGIDRWFHVTDLSQGPQLLVSLRSHALTLNTNEATAVARCLGMPNPVSRVVTPKRTKVKRRNSKSRKYSSSAKVSTAKKKRRSGGVITAFRGGYSNRGWRGGWHRTSNGWRKN